MGHGETPDCSTHYDPGGGWDWTKYMNYVKGQTCKAQCAWDGNLINKDCSVTKCTAVGATCVDDSQGLRCASVFCAAGGKTPAKDVCLPDGQMAHCNSKGALGNLKKCPSGQTCVANAGGVRCGLSCEKEPVAGAEQESFKDLPADTFGHSEISKLESEGIASGCSSSPKLFCPMCELSRQALAKWIVLAAGLPLVSPDTPTFSDLGKSATLYDYVETAAKAGFMTGYPDGTFRPANPVTRGAVAVVLMRAAGLSAPSPLSSTYSDVDSGSWWEEGIEALAGSCVTSGCSQDGSKYCPDKLVSRRSGAVLIARAFGLVETPCGGFVGDDPGADGPPPGSVDPDTGDDVPSIDDDIPQAPNGPPLRGEVVEDDSGCSVTAPGGLRANAAWPLAGISLLVLLSRRRRLRAGAKSAG
jgi:MYXO-CTERM domain-containing protein